MYVCNSREQQAIVEITDCYFGQRLTTQAVLVALDALFDRIQRSLHKKNPIGVEHCKIKLENYIGILFY